MVVALIFTCVAPTSARESEPAPEFELVGQIGGPVTDMVGGDGGWYITVGPRVHFIQQSHADPDRFEIAAMSDFTRAQGRLGVIRGLALTERHVLTAGDGGLAAFDRRDLGFAWALPGMQASAISVYGEIAVVAVPGSAIHVLAMPSGDTPRLVATLSSTEIGARLVWSGSMLINGGRYADEGQRPVLVIDMTDPLQPQLVGRHGTDIRDIDAIYSEGTVTRLVAVSEDELRVLTVDRSNLAVTHSEPFSAGDAPRVRTAGDLVVASGTQETQVLRVTEGNGLLPQVTIATSDRVVGLDLSGPDTTRPEGEEWVIAWWQRGREPGSGEPGAPNPDTQPAHMFDSGRLTRYEIDGTRQVTRVAEHHVPSGDLESLATDGILAAAVDAQTGRVWLFDLVGSDSPALIDSVSGPEPKSSLTEQVQIAVDCGTVYVVGDELLTIRRQGGVLTEVRSPIGPTVTNVSDVAAYRDAVYLADDPFGENRLFVAEMQQGRVRGFKLVANQHQFFGLETDGARLHAVGESLASFGLSDPAEPLLASINWDVGQSGEWLSPTSVVRLRDWLLTAESGRSAIDRWPIFYHSSEGPTETLELPDHLASLASPGGQANWAAATLEDGRLALLALNSSGELHASTLLDPPAWSIPGRSDTEVPADQVAAGRSRLLARQGISGLMAYQPVDRPEHTPRGPGRLFLPLVAKRDAGVPPKISVAKRHDIETDLYVTALEHISGQLVVAGFQNDPRRAPVREESVARLDFIDVSNPAVPALIGSTGTIGPIVDQLRVGPGKRLFVPTFESLVVLDIVSGDVVASVPVPELVAVDAHPAGVVGVTGMPRCMVDHECDPRVFEPDGPSAVVTFDPDSLAVLGRVETGTELATDIVRSDDFAYVSGLSHSRLGGVEAVDLSNPREPQVNATRESWWGMPFRLDLSGDLLVSANFDPDWETTSTLHYWTINEGDPALRSGDVVSRWEDRMPAAIDVAIGTSHVFALTSSAAVASYFGDLDAPVAQRLVEFDEPIETIGALAWAPPWLFVTNGPANEDGAGTTITAIRLVFGKH